MSEERQLVATSGNLPTNNFSNFEGFLTQFGLPVENIIASKEERLRIMNALPEFLGALPDDAKRDARYLSKFIAGTAVGLFDASLNFVWNEVVLNLRKKVVVYGLDYFYDSAIGGTLREQYNDEEDLPLVKDQVLLDTCRKLELISDILHRKLCHILDMRNQIGSSHPNEYSINAYELLGWLQCCINDVLLDKISDSALTVKSIIDNTKKMDAEIGDEYLAHFRNSISQLSTNMVSNLLNSLFGIFVSPSTPKITQINILKLATVAWDYSTDDSKYELGKKIDVYRSNLDKEKTSNAELFFNKCNGEKYFSTDAKIIKITLLCEQLENAHYGWDNYVNETPYAKAIMAFIGEISDVPDIRLKTIISIFLKCRIGNDRYYCEGVSPGAKKYYDEFFELLDEQSVKIAISMLKSKEFEYLLMGSYRPTHVRRICELMLSDILSDRTKEILTYLIQYKGKLSTAFVDSKFKQISKGIL